MTDNLFPILGPTVAPCIGRVKALDRMVRDLIKPTPSHLSVIGPRYAGKTVLLHALKNHIQNVDSHYNEVVLWDLGHQIPDTQESFINLFSSQLGDALKSINPDYSGHLKSLTEGRYSDLKEVVEAMDEENLRVLMIWDGFDKALSSPQLTRNLWDQMRELATLSSLRLITATRRPLRELIRSEDSASSDFWNLFDPTPVRVGVFDDEDREAIYKASGISFFPEARKELENYTSGYPVLFLSLINEIVHMHPEQGADNDTVNRAVQFAIQKVQGYLSYLWDDCSQEAKDARCHLCKTESLERSRTSPETRIELNERGFIKESKDTLKKACRMLDFYLENSGVDTGGLERLFGSEDDYLKNIRGLLELRLKQCDYLDERLVTLLKHSIEDIPNNPDVCLVYMRQIVDRSLDLIWDAELGGNRDIPSEWFQDWNSNGEKGAESYWKGTFPSVKRGHQIRLLQLLTGTDKTGPKAKYVSKNTYALANAAQGFGDFGQHIEATDVPVGVAVAAVTVCLELAACLAEELPHSKDKSS